MVPPDAGYARQPGGGGQVRTVAEPPPTRDGGGPWYHADGHGSAHQPYGPYHSPPVRLESEDEPLPSPVRFHRAALARRAPFPW
ncbi:hypothetical protein SAMN05421810_10694 [Amycolatopsis arida]|uniref:Uncharacterized protein n=1 Tax=Amycolatopsis arida TaxID=587909 RepID=A0A1I5XIM5_9PSEU|nr:hypothetical protein CLV69_102527 [Amycolatopsis arida]SFQ31823.1 hypothetical protein SAMN05421810_10694 [Amycolatopsis arida]